MTQAVQIFNHAEFGNVRIIGDAENPRFCLTDVCKVLGLDASQAMKRLGDGVVSIHPITDSLGRKQNANFVNEDGLYDVILDSRKPKAKEFRKWVTSEVLPSIRKHGVYMSVETAEEILHNPDFIISLAQQVKDAKAKINELETQAAIDKPKVDFYDKVMTSGSSLKVTIIAKEYGMSGRAFNDLLHKFGIQYPNKSKRNEPEWILYQKYAGKGYTVLVTDVLASGLVVVRMYWTQKGREFLQYELEKHGVYTERRRAEICPTLFKEASQ